EVGPAFALSRGGRVGDGLDLGGSQRASRHVDLVDQPLEEGRSGGVGAVDVAAELDRDLVRGRVRDRTKRRPGCNLDAVEVEALPGRGVALVISPGDVVPGPRREGRSVKDGAPRAGAVA